MSQPMFATGFPEMLNAQLQEFLRIPDDDFKRERYGRRQIVIRSRKWGGIFSVHSNLAHDLWATLEADPAVTKLFCMLEPIDVAINSTHYRAAIDYASVDEKDVVTLHRIQLTSEDVDSAEAAAFSLSSEKETLEALAIKGWAEERGAQFRLWSSEELRCNEIYLSNLKKILAFTCQDGYVSNAQIRNVILDILRREREVSVYSLLEKSYLFDEQLVLAEICLLIQTAGCACDLKTFRFNFSSKLSLYYERD